MGSGAVRCLCTELEGPKDPSAERVFPPSLLWSSWAVRRDRLEHGTDWSSSSPVDLSLHSNSNHVSLGPLGKRQVFTRLCNPRHYHRVPRTPARVHSSPRILWGLVYSRQATTSVVGALCIGVKRGSLCPPGQRRGS